MAPSSADKGRPVPLPPPVDAPLLAGSILSDFEPPELTDDDGGDRGDMALLLQDVAEDEDVEEVEDVAGMGMVVIDWPTLLVLPEPNFLFIFFYK